MTDPSASPYLAIDDLIGNSRRIEPGEELTVGRAAEFVVGDDDRFLHRVFFLLWHSGESWMIRNQGSAIPLTVEVRGAKSLSRSLLGPGGVMPMPYGASVITFTTKERSYELNVDIPLIGAIVPSIGPFPPVADPTATRYTPTQEQQELLDALSARLRSHPGSTDADVPSVKQVAAYLAWTDKKTERKIETLYAQLEADGERVYKPKHIFLANYALRQPRRLG